MKIDYAKLILVLSLIHIHPHILILCRKQMFYYPNALKILIAIFCAEQMAVILNYVENILYSYYSHA